MAIGIVDTKYGKLKGVRQEGKYAGNPAFYGIPYGEPPVGDLRWRPPVPVSRWDGIRRCDKHGPAAPHDIEMNLLEPQDVYDQQVNPKMSEDCLYLEVITGADSAAEKRPVYIWFHGGGLAKGYSYMPQYDGNELARKGVVFITVGQRLGTLGYLANPEFTVGGQSGGRIKGAAMIGTPASRGRIKRIIAQSGLKWQQVFPDQEEAERRYAGHLTRCGIDPNLSLKELRLLPMERFILISPEIHVKFYGEMVYDRELVSNRQLSEGLLENARGVDFLCGSNLGEADPFGEHIFHVARLMKDSEDFYAHYRSDLGDLSDTYDFEQLVTVTDENATVTAARLAAYGLCKPAFTNTSRNLMIVREFGMLMKSLNPDSRVYSYLFSHLQPCRPVDRGTLFDPENPLRLAVHGSELPYAFGSLREGDSSQKPWREIDYQLADVVTSYWAKFITRSDPNGDGLPYWPAAGDDYGWIEICEEYKSHSSLKGDLDKLIYEYVEREYGL